MPPEATLSSVLRSFRFSACFGSCPKSWTEAATVSKSWSSTSFLSVSATMAGLLNLSTILPEKPHIIRITGENIMGSSSERKQAKNHAYSQIGKSPRRGLTNFGLPILPHVQSLSPMMAMLICPFLGNSIFNERFHIIPNISICSLTCC